MDEDDDIKHLNKAYKKTPEEKIADITAYTALALPRIDAHLSKPLRMDVLNRALQAVLPKSAA